MRIAALALAASACWTGAVKEPDSTAAHYEQGKRRKLPPRTTVVLAPHELAKQLALDLRNDGASTLLRAIDGPVVLFDTDSVTFTTLCDRHAELASEQWAALLADQGRIEPLCASTGNERYVCRQFAHASPWLSLDFTHDELGFRLVDVVLGTPTPSSIGMLRAKAGELQTQVAAAKCP